MLGALRSLFQLLPSVRRRQFIATILLMLVGAAAELLTVSSVLPLLALAKDPHTDLIPSSLVTLLSLGGGSPMVGAAGLLIVAALAAASVRVALARSTPRLVMNVGHDMAAMLFRQRLRQPYSRQVDSHSSDILAAVEKVQVIAHSVLNPLLQGLLAGTIALALIALMLWIDWAAASIAACFLGIVYGSATAFSARRLRENAESYATSVKERVQTIQEAVGGIRDIILDGAEAEVEKCFNRVDRSYRLSQARGQFLSVAPRYVIEAAGLITLAVAAVVMSSSPAGGSDAIPVLGALALAAQRLLPLLQQAYHGWSLATGNYRAFLDVMDLLAASPEAGPLTQVPRKPTGLQKEIRFDRVGFGFPRDGLVLEDISFSIGVGEHVGVTGSSGSGKTTLLDLLMGLREPTQGKISIDGRLLTAATTAGWQASLAHVPQVIYLTDQSIAANIVFPHRPSEIDRARLREVVAIAQLEPFIGSLSDGLETRVGERGIRLSNGQRQRIGIARALYRQRKVLILDEATSALDEATIDRLLTAIAGIPGLTTVTVSHRAATLSRCDRVLVVDAGRVVMVGHEQAVCA